MVANSSIGRSGWGLYSDVQFESGNYGYGLEIAVKNKGADQTSTPYFATTGTYGIWLPGGGDNSYGGSAANPNNTAIAIGKNASTWNKGIVFFKDGLTGTDGTTGTATAIEMAKGHRLVWRTPGNNTAFSIRSDAASAASDTAIVGQDNAISIFGANAGHIAKFTHVTSGANYLNVNNAAAAAAPSIEAIGSDTDIDVKLSPKGVGCVRSGTYALPVTLGTSAVQVATGAVTTEEVLATITIPAGIMGLNGRLRFSADGALTSSGNTKTIRVRFGGIGGSGGDAHGGGVVFGFGFLGFAEGEQ